MSTSQIPTQIADDMPVYILVESLGCLPTGEILIYNEIIGAYVHMITETTFDAIFTIQIVQNTPELFLPVKLQYD